MSRGPVYLGEEVRSAEIYSARPRIFGVGVWGTEEVLGTRFFLGDEGDEMKR
jgi:hypothetical protein